eukprot:354397-Chlamydomonas_euryale.AAC.1
MSVDPAGQAGSMQSRCINSPTEPAAAEHAHICTPRTPAPASSALPTPRMPYALTPKRPNPKPHLHPPYPSPASSALPTPRTPYPLTPKRPNSKPTFTHTHSLSHATHQLLDEALGSHRVGELFVRCGRDVVLAANVLHEALGALERGGVLLWAPSRDACSLRDAPGKADACRYMGGRAERALER